MLPNFCFRIVNNYLKWVSGVNIKLQMEVSFISMSLQDRVFGKSQMHWKQQVRYDAILNKYHFYCIEQIEIVSFLHNVKISIFFLKKLFYYIIGKIFPSLRNQISTILLTFWIIFISSKMLVHFSLISLFVFHGVVIVVWCLLSQLYNHCYYTKFTLNKPTQINTYNHDKTNFQSSNVIFWPANLIFFK